MNRLRDRVALVSGAAAGIGAATAQLFLLEGAAVVGTDAAPITWRAADGQFLALVHDVRCANQWSDVLERAVARFGGLDILVNCAGLEADTASTGVHDPEHVTLEHWRQIQAVNVEGTVLGCRHALGALRRSAHAAIVNLSSVDASVAVPGDPAYGASKAAIWAYTKSLALYCAGSGSPIRCNSLHPGRIRPDTAWRAVDSAAAGVALARVPMGRHGHVSEVASAALFLASDDASYITGAELFVDGGLSSA